MTTITDSTSLTAFYPSTDQECRGLQVRNKRLIEARRQFEAMVIPEIYPLETPDGKQEIEQEQSIMRPFLLHIEEMLQEGSEIIAEVVAAIKTYNIEHNPILMNEMFFSYAFEALRRGYLDEKLGPLQVATMLLFWGVRDYSKAGNLEVIKIVEGDRINPHAMEIFRGLFDLKERNFTLMQGRKWEQFLAKIKELPASEQVMFGVPPILDVDGSPTILKVIYDLGTTPCTFQGQHFIFSAGLLQTILDVEFGQDAIQIAPYICNFTANQIRNIGTDQRPYQLSFPKDFRYGGSKETRTPLKADSFSSPGWTFSAHDVYHTFVASMVPRTYRKAFIVASEALSIRLSKLPKFEPEIEQALEYLSDLLPDMQFESFIDSYFEGKPAIAQTFWQGVNENMGTMLRELEFRGDKTLLIRIAFEIILERLESEGGFFQKTLTLDSLLSIAEKAEQGSPLAIYYATGRRAG